MPTGKISYLIPSWSASEPTIQSAHVYAPHEFRSLDGRVKPGQDEREEGQHKLV